jgi:hypothetical protein
MGGRRYSYIYWLSDSLSQRSLISSGGIAYMCHTNNVQYNVMSMKQITSHV